MADSDTAKKASKVAAAKARAAEKAKKAKEKRVVRSVNKQAVGFADFIRDHGVVGMAIGLAMGTVASGTVRTIVEGFVTPAVNFVIGTHGKLEAQEWTLDLWSRQATFKWGVALSSLITLIATIFVIYLIVHFLRLDKLKKTD